MFTGSMVALVTPMHAGGEVDWSALDRLLAFHLENGTTGIVSVGTTGESATLSPEEHVAVIKHTVDFVAGQVPVVAGTGSNSTREAIYFTSEAANVGADAALLVTPYYNKPTQHGLVKHFTKIAQAVDLPQLLYNVPSRTAVDLLPDAVEELASIDNIVGIKDATGDLERVKAMLGFADAQRFCLLSGDDLSSREFMLAGGHGVISVTANVAPKLMSELCQTCLAGNSDMAGAVDSKLVKLHRDLFVEANPIPVKWCLAQMEFMAEDIRLPLTVLSAEFHEKLTQALVHAQIQTGS